MVGTGAPDLETTIRLKALAGERGFAAALVLPPYYYSSVSDDGLFAFLDIMLRETNDNALPIYLCNFPQMTGIVFSVELVARLKAAHTDRLAGAKDSSGGLHYAGLLAGIKDFDVFPSNEATLDGAVEKGFSGTISATANISVRLVAQLWRDPNDGEAVARLRHIRETVSARPLVPAVKHLVGCRLADQAWNSVLPPFKPLAQADQDALAPLVEEVAG